MAQKKPRRTIVARTGPSKYKKVVVQPKPKVVVDLEALREPVVAAGDRALEQATAFAAAKIVDATTVRAFLLAQFEWRLACRKLFGRIRQAEAENAGVAVSSVEVRNVERALVREIADIALERLLVVAASGEDRGISATAREIARDLAAAETPAGPLRRVGTLRCATVQGRPRWTIEPHAAGLPTVDLRQALDYDRNADSGVVVIYRIGEGGTVGTTIDIAVVGSGQRGRRNGPANRSARSVHRSE